MILRIATPPPYGYVVVTVYEARGVFGLVLRYKLWHDFGYWTFLD